MREEDYRVARVAYRLALAGARYCPSRYPLTGLLLHHLAEYDPADQPAAIASYGLDRGSAILAVIEHSPAARAGVSAGDILLAVNDRPFPVPPASAQYERGEGVRIAIEAAERQLEDQLRQGPAKLSLLRSARSLSVTLEPLPACPARVRLARSTQRNAFANRGYAILTTTLLGFMRNDDEIAIILGHEMAHIILNHGEQLEDLPGGLLRRIGKNGSRVRAAEEAADRLGLRLAWAAGYDVSAAIPFWQRYWGKTRQRLLSDHPAREVRLKLIAETIASLAAEQAGNGGAADGEIGSRRPR